jgi:myosin-5
MASSLNGFGGQAMRHVWISLDALDAARGASKPSSRDRGALEAAAEGSRYVRAHDDGEADGERQVLHLCACTCERGEAGELRSRRADGAKVRMPAAALSGANPVHQEGMADAAQLSHLNEPSLLALVRSRFGQRDIYSRAGRVLVAINPFESDPVWLEQTYGPAAIEENRVRRWAAPLFPFFDEKAASC